MIVAVLQVRLGVGGSASLKDKRRVVQSLKARLHREHQVSVAEIDSQESRSVATLGIALAHSDVRAAQRVMDRVIEKLRSGRGIAGGGGFTLDDHHLEILTGQ